MIGGWTISNFVIFGLIFWRVRFSLGGWTGRGTCAGMSGRVEVSEWAVL